jgi:hypothetical protein
MMAIPKEQLQLIEQLLNLPGVRVLDADIAEREMTIQIESTDDYAVCHNCGQRATESYCYGEALRPRHLTVFNRRVYLIYRPKRYRCLNCFAEPLPPNLARSERVRGFCPVISQDVGNVTSDPQRTNFFCIWRASDRTAGRTLIAKML